MTLDADFSQILALEGSLAPSVIHLRVSRPDRSRTVWLLETVIPSRVSELRAGCVLVVTDAAVRLRPLPILTP